MEIRNKIVKINQDLGGTLVRPNSLDYACDRFKDEKSIFRKNAYLIRALVIDHPFDDFNKSTAVSITLQEFNKHGIKCKENTYLKGMVRIAKNNVSDINKIESKLRKWCKK